MNLSDFRKIIKEELQYGNKRTAYMCMINNKVLGGMCLNEQEAILNCKNIIADIDLNKVDYELNVVVYQNDIKVLTTEDVLNKIKYEVQ